MPAAALDDQIGHDRRAAADKADCLAGNTNLLNQRRYAAEGIPLNGETIAGIRAAAREAGIAAEVLA